MPALAELIRLCERRALGELTADGGDPGPQTVRVQFVALEPGAGLTLAAAAAPGKAWLSRVGSAVHLRWPDASGQTAGELTGTLAEATVETSGVWRLRVALRLSSRPSNRRRHERIAAGPDDLRVLVCRDGLRSWIPAILSDLSAGGARLVIPALCDPTGVLRSAESVRLHLRGCVVMGVRSRDCECRATVRWARVGLSTVTMGVEFADLPPALSRAFGRFIQRQQRRLHRNRAA